MYHFTIGLCIAVIISMVVNVANAAETRPYMYRAQQTAQLQELINRGSVPVTYETVATTPSGQQVTRYTTRATAINTARLGALARSATGGPAVLAATAAFFAYDYFFNEDTQEWEVSASSDFNVNADNRCTPYSGAVALGLSPYECGEYVGTRLSGGTTYTWRGDYEKVSCGSTNCSLQLFGRSAAGALIGFATYLYPVGDDVPYPLPLTVPATDGQLGDAVKNAPPQAISDILNDPISTGTWPDRWPEMVPTVQDVEDQLAHDIEGAPVPVNPDQTITDGSTARPSDSGSGSGSGDLELPSFCDWVPDWLCDVMDLPEHPDVPYVDIDEPDSFESGIGAGQCPADNVIVTQFGSVPISWALPCQLAETFRPVVLFFAWITALYIVVRIK